MTSLKLINTIKTNIIQPREILQLIEAGNVLVALERTAQIGHCGSFFKAQLAISIKIPVVQTDGFHVGIGEKDAGFNIMEEFIPAIGIPIGTGRSAGHINRDALVNLIEYRSTT